MKRLILLVTLIVAFVALAACGQTTTPAPAAAPTQPAATTAPAAVPADNSAIVEASKQENALVIYSIMGANNWKPVLDGFAKKYPWIKVENVAELASNEIFPRYYSESAAKAKTADLISTSNPDGWQDFIAKGELLVYKSVEDANVPDWSKLAPGVYTASSDPLIFVWNKQAVPAQPKTLADLAAMVEKDPAKFQGKITTYDGETNATGFAANWFYIKKTGEAGWKVLESIAKAKPKLATGAGGMVDDTLSGAISIGYFVSGIAAYPKYPAADAVMGNALIGDGTPIIVRGMGVTKAGAHPNSAKLMLDYILSQEGQIAFAEGGLTAYRPDVANTAKLHLSKLAAAIGEQNLAPFYFDKDLLDKTKVADFKARWKKLFKPQ